VLANSIRVKQKTKANADFLGVLAFSGKVVTQCGIRTTESRHNWAFSVKMA
jgi:hypothetical protein